MDRPGRQPELGYAGILDASSRDRRIGAAIGGRSLNLSNVIAGDREGDTVPVLFGNEGVLEITLAATDVRKAGHTVHRVRRVNRQSRISVARGLGDWRDAGGCRYWLAVRIECSR